MDAKQIEAEADLRMKKSIESLKKDFTRIRTGRASASLLDGITVEYYGSPMPVNQIAAISIPDARMIMIQPWEKNMLGPVEKAIQTSDLGLNPMNDGNVIRLPIPTLSEERRKDLFKHCKKAGEDSKVAIRSQYTPRQQRAVQGIRKKQKNNPGRYEKRSGRNPETYRQIYQGCRRPACNKGKGDHGTVNARSMYL